MTRFLLLLALPILCAGCTTPGPYPSLLPRGGERAGFDEPAAPPPAAATPDPALDAQIAAAAAKAKESTARFDAASVTAERMARAARGAAPGSDAWLNAQTTLADLDVLRAATLEGLSDLEQIAAQRALALTAEYPALDAAIAAVRATGDEQAARITALQAMIAPA